MENDVFLEPAPRSKKSIWAWLKEKLEGADFVAVGVNMVVGVILIGGLIGAMAIQEPATNGPAPDLNAALVAREDPNANLTEPASDQVPSESNTEPGDQEEPAKPEP